MLQATDMVLGTGVSFSGDLSVSRAVVDSALKHGIRRFDTAPSYGTEGLLGELLEGLCEERGIGRGEISLQTKIDAWQMREGDARSHVISALSKLRVEYLDMLLVHWPLPEYLEDTWQQMSRLVDEGLVRSIGVCNVRIRQLRAMEGWDVQPAAIQIERHPLRSCEEEVRWCLDRGVQVQAYSPLCKMNPKIRDNFAIASIAGRHGVDVGQAVMRWHLETGVMPVFTTTKPKRLQSYMEIDDFALSDEEVRIISSVNEDFKMYLESWSCPGF